MLPLKRKLKAEYRLSWRDSTMDDMSLEDWMQEGSRNIYAYTYTAEQLKNNLRDCVVTHLYVIGKIPPEIVDLLTQVTHLVLGFPHPGFETLLSQLTNLEYLVVESQPYSTSLDSLIPRGNSLQTLKELHMISIQNFTEFSYQWPSSGLPKLECLVLSKCHINKGELSDLSNIFPLLKRLKIDSCIFPHQTTCEDRFKAFITLPSQLEALEVTDNPPGSGFSDGVFELLKDTPSLTKLSLNNLPFSTIPQSLSQLTHLQVLKLSNNRQLGPELPDVIGQITSLKKLNLEQCELTSLHDSLSQLTHLQVLKLSNNRQLGPELPDVIRQITSLRELNIGGCGLISVPNSVSQLTQLQVLSLSGNQLGPELPDAIGLVTSLGELNLQQCELTSLPGSLSQLTQLQVLNLSRNRQLGPELPDVIGQITSLRELTLPHCELENLSASLSSLSKLVKINCSYNKFSGELPDIFSNMSSLETLEMAQCGVSSLPQSMSQLTSLVVLNIANGEFPNGLPDVVEQLPSLHRLNLSQCDLTDLPESLGLLTNLEHLDLRGNEFSDLPLAITRLEALKSLNLSCCGLVALPDKYLINLESLELEDNGFFTLPPCIYKLAKLRSLNLLSNFNFKSLGEGILGMDNLVNLQISHCSDLPKELIVRGLTGILQYYTDEIKLSKHKQPFTTAVVIGNSGAGKTSLVKTLQARDRKRVLTGSDKSDDASTKVFNFEDVPLDKSTNMALRFIDMGGQEIYHPAYQLTLRDKCMVLVVVNMKQYNDLRTEVCERESVRRLYFDWLAHLYLAEPQLTAPKLVLTHRDMFDDEEFKILRASLLHATDLVRKEVMAEDALSMKGQSKTVNHLSNIALPVFCVSDVFEIGNETNQYDTFNRMKSSLYESCLKQVEEVPKDWTDVNKAISQLPGCFQTFTDIFDELRRSYSVGEQQLKNILAYMHGSGRLLWFRNVKPLSHYIFHNIPAVTELIKVLYDHNSSVKWDTRLQRFTCSDKINIVQYRLSVEMFRSKGVLNKTVLELLISTESEFKELSQVDVALGLLESFNLVYGPVELDGQGSYLVPQFFDGYLDESTSADGNMKFHAELVFTGYALPLRAFHQITLMVLKQFLHNGDTYVVRKNGAAVTAANSRLVASLVHDKNSQTVSIRLADIPRNICGLWKLLVEFTNDIITITMEAYKAARLKCVFYCPHCQLTNKPHPQKEVNPSWCSLNPLRPRECDGMALVKCCEDVDVPAPLKSPCQILTADETELLERYIHMKLRQKSSADNSPMYEPPQVKRKTVEEELSDVSDGEGYLYPAEDERKIDMGTLRARSTRMSSIKDLYINTDKVYKMSSPFRGRALVINNYNFAALPTRTGSDVDVKNITGLFRNLHFEVTSRIDLTAKEMMSAIKEETSNKHHEDYGMFILVIMSHGKEDNYVCGTDGDIIKLSDVYDLLSAKEFPMMKGEPKLVVIQSCSGERRDLGERTPDTSSSILLTTDSPHSTAGNPAHLNVDDLIVIKSCFETYMSLRHVKYGTVFIRCLVATFYKHASHRDVCSLLDIVQERVRKVSRQLTSENPDQGTGQVPVYFKTLTHLRKVYLFPRFHGPRKPLP